MLKSIVLSAVEALREAVADLKVPATLTRRTANPYVPGAAPTFTEASHRVEVVYQRYAEREIDHDRIKASDYKAILFRDQTSPPPAVNDLVVIDSNSFRVINPQHVMVGDAVAVTVAQLRPA